jgi:hypothetical protein
VALIGTALFQSILLAGKVKASCMAGRAWLARSDVNLIYMMIALWLEDWSMAVRRTRLNEIKVNHKAEIAEFDFKWIVQRGRATAVIADDELTDAEIAKAVGVSLATIGRRKRDVTFAGRVADIVGEFPVSALKVSHRR